MPPHVTFEQARALMTSVAEDPAEGITGAKEGVGEIVHGFLHHEKGTDDDFAPHVLREYALLTGSGGSWSGPEAISCGVHPAQPKVVLDAQADLGRECSAQPDRPVSVPTGPRPGIAGLRDRGAARLARRIVPGYRSRGGQR